ncbi:short-chain dehydrogenase/reductase [Nocardia sp. NBC_01730]|uniref:short-chain dehydrogenase/reductase n=1 Tax=Nocardia sp. NBC_01730 TaxID=2975998 RepID=UPI002E12257D|nr:short-chain dehydrogenase/reductase [Nocardia sp. NBC_01730]
MTDLDGKRVVITGAARGIGLATARGAIARGARVALLDRDELELKQVVTELGAAASAFVADVTDPEGLSAAVAAAAAEFGGIDVVVANAGVAPKMATVAGTSLAEFDRVIGVNLRGVWNTVQAGLPHLGVSRGRLVVVASVYSFVNGVLGAPYAVSKAGVEALARTLRVELAVAGIGITTAYFGFVDTDLVNGTKVGDPLFEKTEKLFPRMLTKRISPDRAAKEILRAVERNRTRVVAPALWRPLDWLRGIVGPLGDTVLARAGKLRDVLVQVRAREVSSPNEP